MQFTKERLEFFAKIIQKEVGIVYSQENFFQLEKRLIEIAKFLNYDESKMNSLREFDIHGHFKDLLLDVATNNETSFFRDKKLFQSIESTIVPEILNQKLIKTINVWSAACSSGQEPYTLAILFNEMNERGLKFNYNILATDFSNRILDRAKNGSYTQLEVQRGLPAKLLIKNFKKSNDGTWKINDEVKRHIKFQHINLVESFEKLDQFDIILCRNILIYQSTESKINIVERMAKKLNLGGFLALGAAESLIGLTDYFQSMLVDGATVYRIKDEYSKKLAA